MLPRVRCAVYLMTCGDFFKVGISVKPRKRLATIRQCNPVKVELPNLYWLGCVEDAKYAEGKVHERLKEFHVRGEWFRSDGLEMARSILSGKEPLSLTKQHPYLHVLPNV